MMNKQKLLKKINAILNSVLRKDTRNNKKHFITDYRNNDVRGFLLTSPLYNSPQSYSQYINQNFNNEMYQHLVNNKPKYNVKTMKDLYNKYFDYKKLDNNH